MALEVATFGITCNAICPGYVKTPLVEAQIADQAKARGISEEAVMRDVILAAQPTKQFVTVEQLGGAAALSGLRRRRLGQRREPRRRRRLDRAVTRDSTAALDNGRRAKEALVFRWGTFMTEFTASQFDALCATDQVRGQIETIETSRKAAVKKFWLMLIGGMVGVLVLTVIAVSVFPVATIFVLIGGIVGVIFLANGPLNKAKRALKLPVLEALAAQGNMQYQADRFGPPGYANAERALFGGFLSSASFTDLFKGVDAEGREVAVYEGLLQRRQGKSTVTVFQGQMYAFKRGGAAQGTTVIVPDKGMFNFFKPGKGMERVKFPDHPEFEKRFEVYSTAPAEAQALLGSVTARERLLALRAKGQLFGYVAADEALFAITGKDRFEPGSMFKSTSGQDRTKAMFDEVCESMGVLKDLRATYG